MGAFVRRAQKPSSYEPDREECTFPAKDAGVFCRTTTDGASGMGQSPSGQCRASPRGFRSVCLYEREQRGAAFLHGPIKFDPCTRIHRRFVRSADHKRDKGRRGGVKRKIVALERSNGLWVGWALLPNGGELNPLRLLTQHSHRAVMRSIPPTARRKIAVHVCSESKQRRYRRQAEQKKERNGQEPAHTRDCNACRGQRHFSCWRSGGI